VSYTLADAEWDEAYEAMARELYPEHKAQAIEEFTSERLRSFYLKEPTIAAAAARSYKEAMALLKDGHPSASYVFFVSSIEQFLKAALLKPVVFGLVHTEALASLIVDVTLSQTGLSRYTELLSGLFENLVGTDIKSIQRTGATKKLLDEIADVQKIRNDIIHKGITVQKENARYALLVAHAVFTLVFKKMLGALGLTIKGPKIVPKI